MTLLTFPQKAKTAQASAQADLWSEAAAAELPTSDQLGWGLALFPVLVLISGLLFKLL